MSLPLGTRLGPYEVVAAIGAGGMGEVYRATDTNLGREVAIKVLPDAFAQDPERIARFEREAKTLASLNHPNIATIHGVEKSQGTYALVMELIEGEDLSQRIARGPIPIDEALPIARQIAEALEAAHEQRIIHRDLKPANIKVTPDGMVKVLDFGLAKLNEPAGSGQLAAGSPHLSLSPTITSPALMTGVGVLLGTAAYMSPEQARGKPADKRSDIWAFGCVLYEMLTRRRAFAGDDVTETIASVVKSDPDWGALPPALSLSIRAFLRSCLAKDPRARLCDIGDMRLALSGIFDVSAAPARDHRRRLTARTAALVAAAMLVVGGVGAWRWSRSPAAGPGAEMRFTIAPPENATFTGGGGFAPAATISPDGRRIVFRAQAASGPDMLWIRPLDGVEARPLQGTENGNFPFWSPDSRTVAFFAGGKLKKIDAAGGPAQTICDATAGEGGSWSADDTILFAPSDNSALFRVSAGGGQPTPATTLDKQRNPADVSHRWPQFLPGGKQFLFLAEPGNEVRLGSFDSANTRRVFTSDSKVLYTQGRVLFVRQGTLMTQAFDAARGAPAGDPVPVAERVRTGGGNGRSAFSASDTGVLVYRTGDLNNELAWFDRSGKRLGSVTDVRDFRFLALSPDDTRAILHWHPPGGGTTGGLWILDLMRGTTSRLTFGSSHDGAGFWSSDGNSVIFDSDRAGGGISNMYRKLASGAGAEDAVFMSPEPKSTTQWSPDGRFLVYSVGNPKTATDIWVLPMFGDRKPVPYLRSEFNEDEGRLSPDGHWMAYASDETGRAEVYVQPFPATGGKWQISTTGGDEPRWRADGKELFYESGAPGAVAMMAVSVNTAGTAFQASQPTTLFTSAMVSNLGVNGLGISLVKNTFAPSKDGQRFLVFASPPGTPPAPITVDINWTSRLTP